MNWYCWKAIVFRSLLGNSFCPCVLLRWLLLSFCNHLKSVCSSFLTFLGVWSIFKLKTSYFSTLTTMRFQSLSILFFTTFSHNVTAIANSSQHALAPPVGLALNVCFRRMGPSRASALSAALCLMSPYVAKTRRHTWTAALWIWTRVWLTDLLYLHMKENVVRKLRLLQLF